MSSKIKYLQNSQTFRGSRPVFNRRSSDTAINELGNVVSGIYERLKNSKRIQKFSIGGGEETRGVEVKILEIIHVYSLL